MDYERLGLNETNYAVVCRAIEAPPLSGDDAFLRPIKDLLPEEMTWCVFNSCTSNTEMLHTEISTLKPRKRIVCDVRFMRSSPHSHLLCRLLSFAVTG